MRLGFSKSQIALAVAAALGATAMSTAHGTEPARQGRGTYVAGDFHNHTTCSDGSISMQKLVKKSTDKPDTPWGLDWFVQAGHGGNGNRNCTLVEDASLATPAYPLVFATPIGPTTAWVAQHDAGRTANTGTPTRRATRVGHPRRTRTCGAGSRCRSSSTRCSSTSPRSRTCRCSSGVESVVAGHEHTSMAVITGQMPAAIYKQPLPTTPGLHAARQRHGARQVGVLLRPRRHRHEPRQHGRRRQPRQQLGLLGHRQPERSGPELERHGAEAHSRRRRRHRRSRPREDRRGR